MTPLLFEDIHIRVSLPGGQMEQRVGIIYFDGLCRACSAEINHYRRLPGSEKFQFIDITDPEFKPQDHGLDPSQVHKVMHVRDEQGHLHQGVDAFIAIWQKIPRYQFLARWARRSAIRWWLEQLYQLFVKIRPYLPRRKALCSTSPYCEIKK